jgi:RNA polymerase sigma-70 factor (ECF subfamily)
MALQVAENAGSWDLALHAERAWLVRLCACLTRNGDAAEDLAQETLVEAWSRAHKLYDPSGRDRWLAAIARNVCRRWARSRGRELARHAYEPLDTNTTEPVDGPADELDVEVDLERHELAQLLDRALALLPPVTRQVLIESYVEESPQAEVAARLGLSEGAVAMRLHRGKLALRRLMATVFSQEAAAYGLIDEDTQGWRETRIWCSSCGQRRFMGAFNHRTGDLVLQCPVCRYSGVNLAQGERGEPLYGGNGHKTALSRHMERADSYFRRALAHGTVPCGICGRPVSARMGMPDYVPPAIRHLHGVYIACDSCGYANDLTLTGLALWSPEGRRFWRAHPRLRALPEREVESAGRAALVTSFESVVDAARLDVVSARDTYEILSVHGVSTEL